MKRSLQSLLLLFLCTFSYAQNWQLVWQDEFNYSGLPDPNKWNYDTGVMGLNAEVQNYTNRAENARVENGVLIIEARRDWYQGTEYSSARMKSSHKGDWKYGRIEVKAKLPLGPGMWPAIWMLPTDWVYGGWPESGEIDIMENYARNGILYNSSEGNIHTKAYNHSIGTNKGAQIHGLSNVQDNYHVYAVSWFDNRIVFDVDGQVYFTFYNEGGWEKWPYDQRFHLIMNIAVGGMLGGPIDPNIFPKRMTVDYVRVYQENVGPQSTTGLVTAYKDCNYSGFSAGFGVGDYNLQKLNELGIGDDAMSSLKITQGFKAILFQDDNFTGGSTVINSDNSCLNGTWNDKVTSIRVLPNGDQSFDGQVFYLQNRESGLFMDIAGGEVATEDGVNVHQWAYTGTKNQQFRFSHLGNGAYKITAENSGKALDIEGISFNNNANVHQWPFLGSDNQKFIVVESNDWHFKLIAQHSGRIVEVAACSHDQQANIQQYDNNNQPCGQWRFIPVNAVTGTGNGLRANYFNSNDFSDPSFSRIDQTVDANWGNGSPDERINDDNFSIRWTGKIQAKYDGEYTFYIDADDGRKLWINGEVIIENWNAGSYLSTGTKSFAAGEKLNMRLDYYEGGGNAKNHFSWSTNILAKEIIPKSQLYANELPEVVVTSPVENSIHPMGSKIEVSADANDQNGNVTKVEFYINGELKSTQSSSPYQFTWTPTVLDYYTIEARAYDSQQAVQSAFSSNVRVAAITGFVPKKEQGFAVYPNPVEDQLVVITHDDFGVASFRVMDVHGRIVLDQSLPNTSVDVSGLSPGVYSVELTSHDKLYVQRFVKE